MHKAGMQYAQIYAGAGYSQEIIRLLLDLRSEVRDLKKARLADGELARQVEELKQDVAMSINEIRAGRQPASQTSPKQPDQNVRDSERQRQDKVTKESEATRIRERRGIGLRQHTQRKAKHEARTVKKSGNQRRGSCSRNGGRVAGKANKTYAKITSTKKIAEDVMWKTPEETRESFEVVVKVSRALQTRAQNY